MKEQLQLESLPKHYHSDLDQQDQGKAGSSTITSSLRKNWILRLPIKVAALALLNIASNSILARAQLVDDQLMQEHLSNGSLVEQQIQENLVQTQELQIVDAPVEKAAEIYIDPFIRNHHQIGGRRLDVFINDLGVEERTQAKVLSEKEMATLQALYPTVFTYEQIRNGVSVFLIFLIIYCFFGIQLATQNYVNPAIDIIKKKGVLGSETMNVTLLAMSNSLAESFIILNSIMFGVSDIGISTVCQQAAFYALINQGMFYLIVEEGTFIDWWIISRETVFLLCYLTLISYFLYGNQVKMWSALVLFILYIVHIILMKYSNKYEVALKKALANYMELNELTRIARKRSEIWRYHQSCKSQSLSIEMLCKIQFNLIDNYIVFEKTGVRKKLDPIICVKLGEEQFAEPDDKALMSRLNFKRAVTKIIIKLQAYKFNQQIINTQNSRQHLNTVLPQMPELDAHDLSAYGNSYYSEDEDELGVRSPSNQSEPCSQMSFYDMDKEGERTPVDPATMKAQEEYNRHKPGTAEVNDQHQLSPPNVDASQKGFPFNRGNKRGSAQEFNIQMGGNIVNNSPMHIEDRAQVEELFAHIDSEEDEFEEYRDHPQPVQLPQSAIYEMILNTAKAGWRHPFTWPSKTKDKIFFILKLPHIVLQHITVPNAMVAGKENFYPLTLLMATFWVWFYSFMIVWCTFVITVAYDWKFSILPMIIYPFGIMLRDLKKLEDMSACIRVFQVKCKDQRLGLAETFSGPVFQITGLMGFAWIMYISVTSKPLSFINESIQYQMPLLLVVIIVKYVSLALNGYKSSKKMFYMNVLNYGCFLVAVVLIDYRIEFFGA